MFKGKSREWFLNKLTVDFDSGRIHSKYNGKEVNNIDKFGYKYLQISDGRGKKVTCYFHGLLMWLRFGETPVGMAIDHKDQNKLNNRADNLRFVPRSVNNLNIDPSNKNSKTGVRGVTKVGNKFRSQICKDRKIIHLGLFDTIEEAERVYLDKKSEFLKNF